MHFTITAFKEFLVSFVLFLDNIKRFTKIWSWPGLKLMYFWREGHSSAFFEDISVHLWKPSAQSWAMCSAPMAKRWNSGKFKWLCLAPGDCLASQAWCWEALHYRHQVSERRQTGGPQVRPSSISWPHSVGSNSVFHTVGPNRVLSLGWVPTFKKSQDFTLNYGFLASKYSPHAHMDLLGWSWKCSALLCWAGALSFPTIPLSEPNPAPICHPACYLPR